MNKRIVAGVHLRHSLLNVTPLIATTTQPHLDWWLPHGILFITVLCRKFLLDPIMTAFEEVNIIPHNATWSVVSNYWIFLTTTPLLHKLLRWTICYIWIFYGSASNILTNLFSITSSKYFFAIVSTINSNLVPPADSRFVVITSTFTILGPWHQ